MTISENGEARGLLRGRIVGDLPSRLIVIDLMIVVEKGLETAGFLTVEYFRDSEMNVYVTTFELDLGSLDEVGTVIAEFDEGLKIVGADRELDNVIGVPIVVECVDPVVLVRGVFDEHEVKREKHLAVGVEAAKLPSRAGLVTKTGSELSASVVRILKHVNKRCSGNRSGRAFSGRLRLE